MIPFAYACGSPIRQEIVKAAAKAAGATFCPEANPDYRGGDAIVWGLIRSAPELIKKVRKAGNDYWHMDNGYFGRNKYFRITKNANQYTGPIIERPPDRFEYMAKKFGISFKPWTKKGSKIILALSTEHLFKFFGDDIESYTKRTVAELKKHTDREIVIRHKDAKGPIETVLEDAYALVTHTSAAALDAFRMGIPAYTTGECCAAPIAQQDLSKIEFPTYPDREPLFWDLAWRHFTPKELEKGLWLDDSSIHRV